jgi:hypothetical protein
MSWIAALDEVGLTKAKVYAALGESVMVREGLINKANEVRAYWQEISPVSTRPGHDLHKDGYFDNPGDYRDSIKIKYDRHHNGFMTATVFTKDPKAHWLEYGSIHNLAPAIGYAQKVVDRFGGEVGGRGKKAVSSG